MKNKHLSVWGVGPIYVSTILLCTCVVVILELHQKLPIYEFSTPVLSIIIGIVLIIIGAILWISAAVFSKLTTKVKKNTLITNGVFAYVRNPIYSAFMFACTGVIVILNNIILLIVPLLFWILLTLLMINTEEKWLKELYKEEYDEYCKKVNRCIPMIRK